MEVFDRYESEVRSYCRNYPVVFDRAKGSKLYDTEGNEYIDFFAGAGAMNYGHNNDYIKKAVLDYINGDHIMHALDMYTAAKRDFIDCFEEKILKPRGFDYKIQFTGPTGTNAVEAALKLARKVKKRSNIFALMGAFHGMTLGSLSLTTDADSRAGGGVALHDVTHIPAPYMFPELDTIRYIEALLTDDHSGVEKPAAIILESMQADGGVFPMDIDYLRRLRELCTKYDILLICDDIQVGCGRAGWFFSFERAGIKPDIVTLSKSIGGYGFPMSIVLLKPELDIWAPGEHNGTFRGNQVAFVAAKAAIDLMLNNNMEAETRRKGEIVREFLEKEIRGLSGDIEIRGLGLLWGIDLSKHPGASKATISECFKNGLVIERAGRGNDVVKVMPPLVISDEELMAGLEIVKKSIAAVLAK